MTSITLTGLAFNPAFYAALPEFEANLARHDYNAADFFIQKVRHPYVAYAGNSEVIRYDYTTQVSGESFVTTFSDDMQFLQHLAKLCFAPDMPKDARNAGIIRNVSVVENLARLANRVGHWLTDTPYKGN